MPHSTKKYRKPSQPEGSKTPIYVVVVIIVIIVALAGGWYVYSSLIATSHPTTTSQQLLSSAYATTVVTINNGATTVSMNMTRTNSTYVIYAMIYTSMGNIEVELFPQSAPNSVANFVNLARSGFYDNLLWHRVISGFVIQGGDPTTKNGGGNPSTWGQNNGPVSLATEIDPHLHNTAGYLALANTGAADSSGSQFFINLADNSANLDGKYTVFGKVISGMNVAVAISNVARNSSDQPLSNVYITKIVILTSGP